MASGAPPQFADSATRSVVLSLLLTVTLVCAPPIAAAALGDNPARAAPRDAPTLLVFAAASPGDALTEVDAAFTAETGAQIKASFAASSVLAKQIEAGA